jgi:hypothetical protein
MSRRALLLLLLAAAIGVVAVLAIEPPSTELTAPAAPAPAPDEPAPDGPRPRCPPGAGNCREADGRILYVERVDPDGDGDAHFALASGESVTGPGLTVVDVRRSLRPSPLPGPGDFLRAAGPVYSGSHGQKQIEATAVRVGR